jgi:ribulose-5-phosphate 4-epimerase/fuculose-1-phosphate aldolase
VNRLELVTQLKDVGKFMSDSSLCWGTAGNISARINEKEFYVSASGTYLGEMDFEDFSLCDTNGWKEGQKPSKEHVFHQGIYEERPEINAILHASPFYSTLIANSNVDLPSNYFVEAMYYLEKIVRIPYYHPGSEKLAEAVKQNAKKGNIMLLEHHGIIVYDTSIKEARMALETLEYTAKMYITSLQSGINIDGLDKNTVNDFLLNSGYKPVRKWT